MSEPWWRDIASGVLLSQCHWTGAKKDKERGDLAMSAVGLEYKGDVASPVTIPWPTVANIQVLEGTERKVSAARVATMGALALAAKKQTVVVSVAITHAGGTSTFVADQDADEVRRAIQPLIDRLTAASSSLSRSSAATSGASAAANPTPTQSTPPTAEAAVAVPAPADHWWAGITSAELSDVGVITGRTLSKTARLRVSAGGIEWGDKKTGLVHIPWEIVTGIRYAESTGQRGRRVGTYVPLTVGGMVNNAARLAHNSKASKVVTRTVIQVTTTRETHKFQLECTSDDVVKAFGPAIELLGGASGGDTSDQASAMAALSNDAVEPATSQATAPPPVPPPSPKASTPSPPPPGTPAGWLDDPIAKYEHRYWDGGKWTEHVSTSGEQSTDFL
jgi:uncharacterized protein DUF2510